MAGPTAGPSRTRMDPQRHFTTTFYGIARQGRLAALLSKPVERELHVSLPSANRLTLTSETVYTNNR
jgi:hypothetical protein